MTDAKGAIGRGLCPRCDTVGSIRDRGLTRMDDTGGLGQMVGCMTCGLQWKVRIFQEATDLRDLELEHD